MDATACGAEERSFEVDSQNFGMDVFLQELLSDVTRDSFGGATDSLSTGDDGGRDERSGATRCPSSRDELQGFRGAFHDVMSAGAMNVHIDKAGNCQLIGSLDFGGAFGQRDGSTRADGLDYTITNQDASVENLGGG